MVYISKELDLISRLMTASHDHKSYLTTVMKGLLFINFSLIRDFNCICSFLLQDPRVMSHAIILNLLGDFLAGWHKSAVPDGEGVMLPFHKNNTAFLTAPAKIIAIGRGVS